MTKQSLGAVLRMVPSRCWWPWSEVKGSSAAEQPCCMCLPDAATHADAASDLCCLERSTTDVGHVSCLGWGCTFE